ETMAIEGGVDDLLLIDPDQSTNDPEVVSVLATGSAWTGSARAETGECFWIRVAASGGTVVGTGTNCSADEASEAAPGTWPEPGVVAPTRTRAAGASGLRSVFTLERGTRG